MEVALPFALALNVLPGMVNSSLGGAGGELDVGAASAEGQDASPGGAAPSGLFSQLGQALPLANTALLMMALVRLLSVKNKQLEDDLKILRGLKVRRFAWSGKWQSSVAALRLRKRSFRLLSLWPGVSRSATQEGSTCQ